MNALGVDYGERRTGVAVVDDATRLAHPVEVIDSSKVDPVARIAELVRELDAAVVVVGRPLSLAGHAGPAVEAQRAFLDNLKKEIDVPVEEFDERLTTVIAERSMREAGANRRRRRSGRDAVAAQIMLQDYIDSRD
ncbi:MAG: Holliday junction resolvase RuvX [Actinomycetota bacterium]|nr:Holliday junction resolvase RuvX [Actinomycetota bacterium]